MKIAAISDLHGDATTYGADRFDEARRALWESVRGAIARKADLFLFLGDASDPGPRAHRVVSELALAAAELHEARIPSAFLAGNHDVVEDGTGATVLDPLMGMTVMDDASEVAPVYVLREPQLIYWGGLTVMALPYVPRARQYDPAQFIEDEARINPGRRVDLVVGHLELAGAVRGSESGSMARGRPMAWPLEALRRFHPHAFLLGGHYHTAGNYNGVEVVGSAIRCEQGEAAHEPGWMLLELSTAAWGYECHDEA